MAMRWILIFVALIGCLHCVRYLRSNNPQRKKVWQLNLILVASGLLLALTGAIAVESQPADYSAWLNILFLMPLPFAIFSIFTEQRFFPTTTTQSKRVDTTSPYNIYVQRIFVKNWPEAVSFYQHNLAMPLVFKDENMGWAQFQLGDSFIAIERCDKDTEKEVGRFVGLSLQVKDINLEYENLKRRGVRFESAPEKQPWGGVTANFKDPEDNILTLLSEADQPNPAS